MNSPILTNKRVTYIMSGIVLFSGMLLIFLLFSENKELKQSIVDEQNKYIELEGILQHTKDQLAKSKEDINSLNNVLTTEQKRITSYESKLDDYTDTISELEKLTTIEPVLLQKYSKIYFLNEHYTPPELKSVRDEFLFNVDKKAEVDKRVYDFLNEMLEVSNNEDIPLRVVSAYRSFDTQSQLKSNYTVTYGAGTANQFSADQGYSEHQLGTTVDLTIPRLGGLSTNFETTDTYKWLMDNAHKYGFVLSYPKGNSYYQFEPWHWRFVGTELAKDLHNDGKNFYDLSQREIDEYLVKLFD